MGDWQDPREDTRGLAYHDDGAGTKEFFALDASKRKLVRLDSSGQYIRAWTLTGFDDVRGLTFVGDVLYLADVATGKVYKATVPSGVEVTQIPQGITYDGTTYLYIVVDALPKDKILVVNPTSGVMVNSYDAPSAGVAGITYLGGYLWVVDNDTSGNSFQRRVRKLDPTDGIEVDDFIGPDGGWSDFSSITNNGTDLIVGRRNDKALFVMRPSDGSDASSTGATGRTPSKRLRAWPTAHRRASSSQRPRRRWSG